MKDEEQIRIFHVHLRRIGTPIEAKKHTVLYRAGDVPDSCYLIESGRIISTEMTAGGREWIFSTNEAGHIILLPAVILHRRLTLDFRADVASKLIRVRREELQRAMGEEPAFLASIFHVITVKYSALLDQFQATSHMMPWKVCNLLLTLGEKHGEECDGKLLIRDKCSQQMMADLLHANRTTIARIIKDLTEQGLIERINNCYCIRSVDALRAHMEELKDTEFL